MKDEFAQQLYYTSCRIGLGGHSGFQTRAESQGLLPEERREIESKSLYQPPRDLPYEPDEETIATHFPKAFRTVNLSSGRTALIRSVYCGKDYSGRWGNYFAHALILPDFEYYWPIDVCAWEGWVGSLSAEADGEPPTPLPLVRCADLMTAKDFTFEELKTFLSEAEGRKEHFSRMLRAVFRRQTDSRSLLIRERLELDCLYWVACIQKAFPPGYQRELTCSTFQFDPRSALAVNATVGETDFLFDEAERKYQFYLFDFVVNGHSTVPEDGAEYADTIATWMAAEPSHTEGLHAFAGLFKHREISPRLHQILQLYRLVELGEKLTVPASELHSIFNFVQAYAQPQALKQVLDVVSNNVDLVLGASAEPEDWAMVISFLAAGAASTGDSKLLQRAACVWVDTFDTFVVGQQRGEGAVMAARSELARAIGPDARTLAEAFLSTEHLNWLLQNSANLPTHILALVASEIETCSRILGNRAYGWSPKVLDLIKAVLDRKPGQDLQWALAPFGPQISGLTVVVRSLGEMLELLPSSRQAATLALGRSLASVLRSNGEALRFELIAQLKGEPLLEDVLFEEAAASLEAAVDKVRAHSTYESRALSDDSKFASSMKDRLAMALFHMLPENIARKQGRSYVESGRVQQYMTAELARTILTLASQDMNFDPNDRDAELLATKISAELNRRGLRLDPDRLALRELVRRMLSGLEEASKCQERLKTCDVAGYTEVLRIVVPGFQLLAANLHEHKNAILCVANETHVGLFKETYCRMLAARPRKSFDSFDITVLVVWLCVGKNEPTFLSRLREPVLNVMAERIASMTAKSREQIADEVERRGELKSPSVKNSWKVLFEQINKPKPSWISRLLGFGKH